MPGVSPYVPGNHISPGAGRSSRPPLCSLASRARGHQTPRGKPLAILSSLWALCSLPRWRVFLVNLCRQCIEKTVDLWVLTLPVLHHCVAPSPQGKDSRIQPEDTWAALEGIPFSEFREKKTDR